MPSDGQRIQAHPRRSTPGVELRDYPPEVIAPGRRELGVRVDLNAYLLGA
ncbi:hypothetical protein OG285_25175 [Streptomyces sp. NBC_01471]